MANRPRAFDGSTVESPGVKYFEESAMQIYPRAFVYRSLIALQSSTFQIAAR
jgi:hypothetical protein